jgi:hypothetical protein
VDKSGVNQKATGGAQANEGRRSHCLFIEQKTQVAEFIDF